MLPLLKASSVPLLAAGSFELSEHVEAGLDGRGRLERLPLREQDGQVFLDEGPPNDKGQS